ncbi:hypothetical protein cgR_2119 [Corynebacterium glutamicum R]|uniref:Secreted protein n=1 Tax=Corynebacterium glutamicum (strain R) TaxID=340322 RepID=A0AB72VCQ1_CORGB|nr:hypothetical protein cgR_2119 [Corynebacterium glutamicum R]
MLDRPFPHLLLECFILFIRPGFPVPFLVVPNCGTPKCTNESTHKLLTRIRNTEDLLCRLWRKGSGVLTGISGIHQSMCFLAIVVDFSKNISTETSCMFIPLCKVLQRIAG